MRKKWVLVAGGVIAFGALLVAAQFLSTRGSTPVASPTHTAGAPAGAVEATSGTGIPGVIAPLPGGPKLPAIKPTSAAKPGARLHPLTDAPRGLISGVSPQRIAPGSTYSVRFKPWGYGPANRYGQTVAVTVTKATPTSGAPDIAWLVRSPLLAVMYAAHGGNVLAGGTQAATLTFSTAGANVVPVLSRVGPAKP
jgi:hypothetical protein